METFLMRKSSAAASTDDRSRRLREGNGLVQKRRDLPKLASDWSPRSSDTISEYSVKCESGWRFSKQATGTPIKKLLAEEMSRETEAKKRSPGVIARLMGFDGLPPQQLSNKQAKRSTENYQQRMVSTEKSQRSSTSCSRRSSRRSSKEEQEFKDVFEVSDSSTSKITGPEIAYVKQKFQDVTRLSTDDKLRDSQEFHDAIVDLNSNKDLLLKYLEQPDSLFTKHLHDLQADPLPSHCSHISGMKLVSPPEHGSGLSKNRKNHFDPLGSSKTKPAGENARFKLSKIQAEGKVESSNLPTRIVVLKPNCGKLQNAIKTGSSPQSSHDLVSNSKKHSELSSVKDKEAESCGKRRFSNDAVPSRYKSKESREIAKEITRQMRNNFERGHSKISSSGSKGYAGDESSSNRSDNESSANESDVPTLVSKNPMTWSNRHRLSSSRSAESSVSREAKKRLSERWKMTHRSMDMGVFSRGSTLGEMLAMPHIEGRPANADAMVGEKGLINKVVGIDRPAGWVEPLGISSRDGWKDGRDLSRSRSVPASCTTSGSPRTGLLRETLCNEKYLLPKEVTHQERIKVVKGNFNHREASSSRNSRSHTRRSHFSVYSYTDYSDTSPEIQFSQKKVASSMIRDDHIGHTVSTDSTLAPQAVVDVEIENASMPSNPNSNAESPAYMTTKDNSSTVSQESSIAPEKGSVPMQHSGAELESTGSSSKEADQPSPVSVLETPFPDDVSSSSENFESLSADLHGLRMQLQLLKLESEPYQEGAMIISSDEDNETREEQGRLEESNEFSYLKHVLTESGINISDQDIFIASLHSSECPVNPLVFEELENHWGLDSWPRWDRKLLFDRINSAIVVIKQRFGDSHPWVGHGNGRVNRWSKNGVMENIEKLLEIQEKNGYKDDAAVMDSQWLDLREGIDVFGREIEKMIMEDLVNEIVVV